MSNLASAFIDIATAGQLENNFMYTSDVAKINNVAPDPIMYFQSEIRRSTMFTQIPVKLSNFSGTPGFGQTFSVNVTRSADYLLTTWLLVKFSRVQVTDPLASGGTGMQQKTLRWARNLGHSLLKECKLEFNDMTAMKFDNSFLDFWSSFTVPGSKKDGYANMIGDWRSMPGMGPNDIGGTGNLNIDACEVRVPLPFFFSRAWSQALPVASLPFNEIKITLTLRNWTELLTIYDVGVNTVELSTETTNNPVAVTAAKILSGTSQPSLTAEVWGNYAVVDETERKMLGYTQNNMRTMLVEQVQTSPVQAFTSTSGTVNEYNLRFSHAVKALFFGARNDTVATEVSNYSSYPIMYSSPYENAT